MIDKIQEIDFDHVYSFKIDPFLHEKLPERVVKSISQKIARDGRAASPIITSFVHEVWFEMEYVDIKHLDFKGCGFNIEKKMFTRRGTKFCPSGMLGSGRKIVPDEAREICEKNELIYLLADANEFPNVYIRFVAGKVLHTTHKSCSIGYTNKWRQTYFGRNVVS